MAFTLFKKKQPSTDPALVPLEGKQDVSERPTRISSKSVKRDWKQYPIDASVVLIRPFVTEKAMRAASANVYVFEVGNDANKISIKKAFYNCYGVMPEGVRIVRSQGKDVRYGRTAGKRKSVKKAMIRVPKGSAVTIGA